MIAETKPFDSDENGKEEEEEGVVKICVPNRSNAHNRKGEVDVGGKDAVAEGLFVGSEIGNRERVGGECVVLVNGKVESCHGKGRRRGFCYWWRRRDFYCGGSLAEEEDGLVTLGSRGSIGGDFIETEDGEGCLGTMLFNIRIMTSSLEAMEVWDAAMNVWAAASLAIAALRRSTQATESSVSTIEEWQVGPNDKGCSLRSRPRIIFRGKKENKSKLCEFSLPLFSVLLPF
ncbi:hypothetical protein JHK86_011105 [Glycine max]|nr:hypothetical protein JHK86_011105 [Glycine max]